MFRFEINGQPIPLPTGPKLDATTAPTGFKTAFIANGSYGEVDLYYQNVGIFTLLYIHCSLRDQVHLHIRKTTPLPELDMSIHQAITILEKGKERPIKPGHFTFRYDPDGSVIRQAPAGEYTHHIIYFPASTIKQTVVQYTTLTRLFLHTLGQKPYQQRAIPCSIAMLAEWQKIITCNISSREIRQPYLEPIIKTLLLQSFAAAYEHLSHRPQADNQIESRIRLAAAIIDDAPHLRHSINSLSRQVGTNPFTLKQEFKKILGTTIHGYLVERKVELVIRLLLETNLTEEAIALQAGYYGSQSLIRLFRKKFGVTPRTIRAV